VRPVCSAPHHGGCSSAGRAPGCDPGCRGFEPRHSPHIGRSRRAVSPQVRSLKCDPGTAPVIDMGAGREQTPAAAPVGTVWDPVTHPRREAPRRRRRRSPRAGRSGRASAAAAAAAGDHPSISRAPRGARLAGLLEPGVHQVRDNLGGLRPAAAGGADRAEPVEVLERQQNHECPAGPRGHGPSSGGRRAVMTVRACTPPAGDLRGLRARARRLLARAARRPPVAGR
jgi:hypothetical protein